MTRRLRWGAGLAALAVLVPGRPQEPPPLDEVLGLVRAHLSGCTEAELNAAAVSGLLDRLRPRVLLLSAEADNAENAKPLLARTNLFEEAIACLRVGRVAEGLAEAIQNTLTGWDTDGRLHGLVLDLRFAGGEDYAAAAAVADLFASEAQPLLEWGNRAVRATTKTNALALRLAVLINRETRGAAEALAAVLREIRAGLLLGSATAGEASVYQNFPLSTGQQLRVAVAPVRVGPGGKTLTTAGVTPDIRVEVPLADEQRYAEDPYFASAPATARAPARLPRLTEADLVRLHREGMEGNLPRPRREEPLATPRITDPVLQRALDLLKGLAVLDIRTP